MYYLASISNGTLTAAGAFAAAVGGILTGILAWLRNKKTDKLALYSQFVDDLHEEVARLRTQYEEDRVKYENDRKGWDRREIEFTRHVEELKVQIAHLERELGLLKGRQSRSPAARRDAAEQTIAGLEVELSRAYAELELLRASAPIDRKRAARSVIGEMMKQMGLDPPVVPLHNEEGDEE